MTERRRVNGQRLSELASETGYVSLHDAARYFGGIDRRTLIKVLTHAHVPILRLTAHLHVVKIDDLYQLEDELRLR